MPETLADPTMLTVDSNWNGKATTLQDSDRVNMAQTPAGSMFFTYLNKSSENSQGKLSLASGGSRPQYLVVPELATTASWKHQNWQGQNLRVTNVSGLNVPIEIQAVGPGMPGTNPAKLTIGKEMSLKPGDTAQVTLEPRWISFRFSNAGFTATFAVIGGPRDEDGRNGYTFTVNAQQNNFPSPPGDIPPPGDYATTSNAFEYLLNWNSNVVFFACMSGQSTGSNMLKVY